MAYKNVSLGISMVFINKKQRREQLLAFGQYYLSPAPFTFFTVILTMTSRRPVCVTI